MQNFMFQTFYFIHQSAYAKHEQIPILYLK